ncbi:MULTISPECIES: zinc ribbon domain-containing protein [Paenibacillus]|uniref:Zinc ribbon domain-containing protein n=1 Tax=Paenibacillus campinasensis TaxID=66347 RepID=A0A268F4D1_9BACL|nr:MULTISPECIES: zinc ribbon domain-containing protein [Paenibacillus]PAD80232.1 zinc ribbon domain-containing protein [Paenibacillus campinasensis]PAK55215.1 zinc ribbon domain-containing protein [Paenibacillus sp. 7541]
MSFFDKFKAGVSEAGNKAKILVEVNKLKLQNSSKRSEIDGQLLEIGKIVYASAESGAWPPDRQSFEACMRRIQELKFEMEQNELQIANLSDEKLCRACGKSSAMNARFCPHCGATFEVIQVNPDQGEDTRLLRNPDDNSDPRA